MRFFGAISFALLLLPAWRITPAVGAPATQPVVRLQRGAVKVRTAPRRGAPRRGLIGGPRAVFPLLGRVKAPGCAQPWYHIGPEAFVCSRRLRPGRGHPQGQIHPRLSKGRLMPHRYVVAKRLVVVRSGPSPTAPRLRTLREGSGVVLRAKVRNAHGVWRRTRRGYLPAAQLRFVRPSRLSGVPLKTGAELPLSWINGATAWVTSRPTLSRRARVGGLKAYTRVRVLETRRVGKRRFARIGPKRWVDAERIRTARLRAMPKGLGPAEKWIHVSLRSWTLVAYQGRRPVYAALISRGIKTPKGTFRVTRKLATATLRFQTRSGEYEAEAVPWVVYFKPRYALHAAYWHDSFGDRYSHGCVNLSPVDARWVFEWASPALPRAWYQIRSTAKDRGTFVLIE